MTITSAFADDRSECRLSTLSGVRSFNTTINFVNSNNESVSLNGSHHLEYERRFNLNLPMTLEVPRLGPHNMEGETIEVNNVQELLANDLLSSLIVPSNIIMRQSWTNRLGFSSYKFDGQSFHSVPVPAQKSLFKEKTEPGKYEVAIDCRPFTFMHSEYSWDHIFNRYIIGKQREVSVYYDTPDGALKKRGIAVREKKWSPNLSGNKFEAQGLFVKIHSDKNPLSLYNRVIKRRKSALFTIRDEIHFKPDNILSKEDTRLALIALLKSLNIQIKDLVPIVRIENIRHGLNMDWYTTSFSKQKIGFVVFDEYTSRNLAPDGSVSKTLPKTYQIEFEIFPEYYQIVNKHYEVFNYFFKQFQKSYKAIDTTAPKYMQSLGNDL